MADEGTIRFNLGCGLQVADGWTNVDLAAAEEHVRENRVLIHDLRFAFHDGLGPADYAVAHHVFDMLTDVEVGRALEHVCDLLDHDGVLRVSTPDIVAGFRAWERGDNDWFPLQHASIDERFCTWLTWHGTRRSLWTFGRWSRGLYQAGFRDVRRCEFGLTKLCADAAICELDTRPGESVFLEAIK